MTQIAQQVPILFEVGNIAALTQPEAEQVNKYIELGTILDVQFKDASGEIMVPIAFKPETVSGSTVTAPAVVTVVKNGSVVKASAAPIVYDFTSYEADKTTKIADGKVQLTGEKMTIGDDGYIQIVVTENDVPEWVGRTFLVTDTAVADGTTKYKVYLDDGTDTGMWVTISEEV